MLGQLFVHARRPGLSTAECFLKSAAVVDVSSVIDAPEDVGGCIDANLCSHMPQYLISDWDSAPQVHPAAFSASTD
jgi:hypothetical protein